MNDNDELDLAAIRARLKSVKGMSYGRSLEELAETEEFKALLAREFPRQALAAGVLNRRDFLKLMAASLALAGLSACGQPQPRDSSEKIVPYVNQPQPLLPRTPPFFSP